MICLGNVLGLEHIALMLHTEGETHNLSKKKNVETHKIWMEFILFLLKHESILNCAGSFFGMILD